MSKLICKNKQQGQTSLSVLTWLVAIILGITLTLFLMRNALVKATIEYVAADQDISVDCIAVDLSWQLDVLITQLCITSPNLSLVINDAVWNRADGHISVQAMQIKHHLTAQNEQITPSDSSFELALIPTNLPSVRIKHVQLTSSLLAEPLAFSLNLENATELTLAGDINAKLSLKDNRVSAHVNWSAFDVVNYVPAAKAFVQQYPDLLNDNLLKAFTLSSDIDFDGAAIQSTHLIEFTEAVLLSNCHLGLSLKGSSALTIGDIFKAHNMTADFSELNIHVDLADCTSRPQLMQDWQAEQFVITLPQPIDIQPTQVNLPQIIISKVPDKAESESWLSLELKQFNYILSGEMTADYQLQLIQDLAQYMQQTGKMTVLSRGSVNLSLADSIDLASSGWGLSAKQNQLTLENYHHNSLSIASAQLGFELQGNQDMGLALSGDLQTSKLVTKDMALNEISSQYHLNIMPPLNFTMTLDGIVNKVKRSELEVASAKSQIQLSGQLHPDKYNALTQAISALSLTGKAAVNQVHDSANSVAKVGVQFKVQGESLSDLTYSLEHQVNDVQSAALKTLNISGSIQGRIQDMQQLTFNGVSNIAALNVSINEKQLKLAPTSLRHKGSSGLNLQTTLSVHELSYAGLPIGHISQQQAEVKLEFESVKVSTIQALISQILPDLTLVQGNFSGTVNSSLAPENGVFSVNGLMSINDVGGHYANTLFSGVDLTLPVKFDSAGLQLDKTTLKISSINPGIPVEKIEGILVSEQGAFKFENISGDILGGRFSMNEVWLDQREQVFDVVLQDLDLEKMVALQNQPGIRVTGKMMGAIPIATQGASVEVDNGRLVSQCGGKLTISNNAAFDTIKQQQSSLSFLENYQFSQLSSKVTFKPDGWLYLDLAFVGENPQKKQAVNFNYSHQENMFDLLRALRVANGIQDKIEKNITQGGKQ
ncbi:intermembrane phospholipid transport protein YdbH family protein [Flavobacterium sp. W21_SRS_FM6]|uniref:intermembrane phospholipid transport protein YdbH family protein n=1 Tax=Flavobacterium sp. W21_SRS_FM6 TaxID=3240268 RepID=UPI003F919088